MYPAILDFENFPLLTRRQPGTYLPFRPNIQPFVFDLFLGKPALFYSHFSINELFADDITAFNQVADQVNQLQGSVEWQSLGTILRRLYLEKRNDDGSMDVRMFTNHLILTNDSDGKKNYHITKEENLNVPISKMALNGKEYPYRLEESFLKLDVVVPAGSTIEIFIQYGKPQPVLPMPTSVIP
jgi:hypothetical protein